MILVKSLDTEPFQVDHSKQDFLFLFFILLFYFFIFFHAHGTEDNFGLVLVRGVQNCRTIYTTLSRKF